MTSYGISSSSWVCFTDTWSGHSSVTPWIGGWSSGRCCHSNCEGYTGKGTDDCPNWRVLDERQGPLYNHGSVSQVSCEKKRRRNKNPFGMVVQQFPKCLKITDDLCDRPDPFGFTPLWQFRYLKGFGHWRFDIQVLLEDSELRNSWKCFMSTVQIYSITFIF